MKRLLPILLISLILNGCWIQWDYSEKKLNDYISISWVDLPDQQGISFSRDPNSSVRSRIIDCYVFAVGKSENCIIAKQHPSNDSFCENPDIDVTNYFIIENINLDDNKEYAIYGPMDSIKFEIMRKELNIEDVEFSIVFPEDPSKYRRMGDYL